MKLTSAVQEALVTLAFYDDESAPVVAGLLPTSVYDSYYRDLMVEAVAYLEQYGEPAGEHTLDIVDALCARSPEDVSNYTRIFESIKQTKDSINRKYVLDQAGVFGRYQRLKAGIGQAIDALQRNTPEAVSEAEEIIGKALNHSYSLFDPGTTLSDTSKSLAFLDDDRGDTFPCGIEPLDRLGLGPTRGRIHLFAAEYGRGKSWWLVNLAKHAVMDRKKVLYVTLELSEAEVCQRLFQCFFAITKREGEVLVQEFKRDGSGDLIGFMSRAVDRLPALSQSDISKFLTAKAHMLQRRARVVVKNFPTGKLTVRELEAYLAMLEQSERFVPDLLIVDYPGLMNLSRDNFRIDHMRTFTDLRGIGVLRNMAVAVVGQLNRPKGVGRKSLVGGERLAEDWSQGGTSDYVVIFNQTQEEKELGLARLFIDKGRTDEDKFTVLISQAYAMGQFCMDATRMSNTVYWDVLKKDQQADEEEEDGWDE